MASELQKEILQYIRTQFTEGRYMTELIGTEYVYLNDCEGFELKLTVLENGDIVDTLTGYTLYNKEH